MISFILWATGLAFCEAYSKIYFLSLVNGCVFLVRYPSIALKYSSPEFFYFSSVTIPNFDKMIGNQSCKQIPWDKNSTFLAAWKEGRTGFPFIDAIMTQLRLEVLLYCAYD